MSDQADPAGYDAAPLLRPVVLSHATFASTDLDRTRRFVTGFLGLETVRPAPDYLLIRDRGHRRRPGVAGRDQWVLKAIRVPEIATPQHVFNHWGVDADSPEAVDRIRAEALARQAEFGFRTVQKARQQHGSYSFYLEDADTVFWEIEYRPPGISNLTLKSRDVVPDDFGRP